MQDIKLPRRTFLTMGAALAGLCAGCAVLPAAQVASNGEAASAAETTVQKAVPDTALHLRDNPELYTVYDDSGVVTMYLTVSRGNSSEGTDHTWSEINHYSVYDYNAMGVPRYQVNALLQVGDENGPAAGEVGYGETAPNATVQVRGQTSSRYAQKNYKIKLKKNKGTWRGQRTIALNKHMGEGLRFRNKMAYDLIRDIEQMMGLRTQFVHLYVKDLTQNSQALFEDYGLYTQVEQLNKTALKTHGLDPSGQLYKINFFEFDRYEDSIKLATDPTFDKSMFEYYLEIKGDNDHSKLIRMLETLNDNSEPMEEVLAQYFDLENIAYWMAFQLLTGNTDTQSRNLYLYSPQNLDTWYLLDWDNDGMLMRTERSLKNYTDGLSWERGVSNYWGNVLFRRCLQTKAYCQKLDEAVEALHTLMNAEHINAMVAHYRSVTEPFLWRLPDAAYEPLTPAQYAVVAGALAKEIEENYQTYYESYAYPMPFFIAVPEREGDRLCLRWDAAYDFDAEDIYYTVDLARDYQFNQILLHEEGIMLPEVFTSVPAAGQYFVRVRATNFSGYTQDAFDYYVTDSGKHYGMKCFYVQPDGSIAEDVYEE